MIDQHAPAHPIECDCSRCLRARAVAKRVALFLKRQCHGTIKGGRRCRQQVYDGSEYCSAHRWQKETAT